MFPCLEDGELAAEYEKGNFTIERNIFLSLHSGLGIDTYPIGIDEKPERVWEILKLLQKLSNKYNKALSCRFVSDGKTGIGGNSDFFQTIDLIFHQRNKWRDHHRQPLFEQSRNLKAERLPAAGWQDRQRIPIFKKRPNHLFLKRTKRSKPPIFF